jgi:hypothetical protein
MITSIRSPSQNAAVLSSPLGRTRVSSHKFFAHPTSCRSILAFLAPSRSAQTRRHASPCAIAPPVAAHWHSRGTLAAQIPIQLNPVPIIVRQNRILLLLWHRVT